MHYYNACNDSNTFIQGLERVINATSEIKNFTAIIIADNNNVTITPNKNIIIILTID